MASQRLFIAAIAGETAAKTASLFALWRADSSTADKLAVDGFCAALRENADSIHVLYYSEWIDRWLMGDRVPGPGMVKGRRFQATCLSRAEAIDCAAHCGGQFQEEEWLGARLREAALAWNDLVEPITVVVVRQVLDGSATDEEIRAALGVVPSWLSMALPRSR